MSTYKLIKAVLFLSLPLNAYALPSYSIQEIASNIYIGPNQTEKPTLSINNQGEVALNAYVGRFGPVHAFNYSNSSMTDLGSLGGGESIAFGINDNGVIVGGSKDSGLNGYRPFFYDGSMHNLLPGATSGYHYAYAINNSGVITGAGLTSGIDNGFGINEHGQITGNAWFNGVDPITNNLVGLEHAIIYYQGQIVDIGMGSTSSGIDFSFHRSTGYDINDNGQVVGSIGYGNFSSSGLFNNTESHAFLYSNNQLTDLGAFTKGYDSAAFGINNAGLVVGYAEYYDNGVGQHAFIWDGALHNLDDLIDNNSFNVSLLSAAGINDYGQIVAFGFSGQISNGFNAYLLSPISSVPVPPAYWLFGSVIAGFGLSRSKRKSF